MLQRERRKLQVKEGYRGFFRHLERKNEEAQARTSVNLATQTQTIAQATTMVPVTNSGARWTLNGGAVLKWCFGRATCE